MISNMIYVISLELGVNKWRGAYIINDVAVCLEIDGINDWLRVKIGQA